MTLYVIGNGYDIANGLDTRYSDFANWLKKYDNKKYDQLKANFELSDEWNDWENKIASCFNKIEQTMKEYKIKPYNDLEKVFATNNTLEKLLRKWLKTIKVKNKISTDKNIINFNYTDYIKGKNVINIHGCISSEWSLSFGHSQQKKWEWKLRADMFWRRDKFLDPNVIYNQLSKNPNIAKQLWKVYFLLRNPVSKIIFYGFSFGKQDIGYFDELANNENINVSFYYKNNVSEKELNELKERVRTKFPNAKFIRAKGLLKL